MMLSCRMYLQDFLEKVVKALFLSVHQWWDVILEKRGGRSHGEPRGLGRIREVYRGHWKELKSPNEI